MLHGRRFRSAMRPRRTRFFPPVRARWAPASVPIVEIEPRATEDWIFVHKLEGVRDDAGNLLAAQWFSEAEKRTSQTDVPADERFREVIVDPGDYQWSVFGNGRVPGLVTPAWGSVAYGNTDDYFGSWALYTTDGAKLTCWFGPRAGAFPAEFRKVFIAYIDGYPEVDDRFMRLKLRGREKLFERPLVALGFTDALGSEGGIDLEIAGIPGSRLQFVVMGEPPPFEPILTNDLEPVFFVQGNATDPAVNAGVPRLFDGGGELGGAYGWGINGGPGTFNLLARPHGPLLASPVSEIRVELRALSSGRYSSPTVTARPWDICTLASIAGVPVDPTKMAAGSTNYGCGHRRVETQSVKDVLNDIAAFNVASIGFDRLDRFFARPITPSFSGTSVHTFRDAGTYSDGKVDGLRWFRMPGMEKRVYRLKVHGGETTRSSLIGDVADAAIRDMLSRDGWMVTFTADHAYNSGAPFYQRSTILDTDPTAEEMEVSIIGHQFRGAADMLDFAARLLPLHGSASVACSFAAFFGLDTMALGPLDVVTIQTTRSGGARNAVLVRGHSQLKRRRIEFTGWSHRESDAPVAGEITITRVDDTVGAGGGGAGSGVTGRGDAAPQITHDYVVLADKTSAIATGESAQDFVAPYDMTLVEVIGVVTTVLASGSLVIDIKVNGVSILATKITVEASERSSLTAATPPSISAPSLLKGDRVTFHVDSAGTGGKGPSVILAYYPRS